MTDERSIERLLDAWFADGPSMGPDRILDVAADRIGRQRQRPAWRLLSWRDFHVITTSKLAAVAVAVLVISVLGVALVRRAPGGSNVGGPGATSVPSVARSPSPTPSATLSPAPSPTPRNAAMTVQAKPVTWTADVPAGWSGTGTWFLTKSLGVAGPTGIAVAAPGGTYVPSDPCDGVGKVSTYKTPADVVAALRSRTDFVVSDSTDTTLGGYAGLRVDVQAPADLSACADLYILFAEPDGSGVSIQGPSQLTRMWILDVQGHPTVFQIQSFPGTPAADLAEAQQIVDSIVVTP